MSDNEPQRSTNFIIVVAVSVLVAIILVAGGIYYYVRPKPLQPQDQAQSIETDDNIEVSPFSLRQTIDEQLDQLQENDFDQRALSDDALGIN